MIEGHVRALAASLFFSFSVACGAGSERSASEITTPALPTKERASCGAQERPTVLGTCEPVGPTAVPEGFERDGDGWGFRAIRPEQACKGAARAALGKTDCVPIDDCDAPFPPAGASIIVRPGTTPTLDDAIESAPSNSVVAVEAGTYKHTEVKGMLARPGVHVIGRCSRDVVIQGTGENAAFGVPRGKLFVEGVTLDNFRMAVVMLGATAELEARRVLFRSNGASISAEGGARAKVMESVFENAAELRTSIDPVRSVIAEDGARIEVIDSDVRDADRAFTALGTNSAVDVRRTVATTRSAADDIFVLAMAGGSIAIEESALVSERVSLFSAGRSRQFADTAADNAAIRIRASELRQDWTLTADGAAAIMGGALVEIDESSLRFGAAAGLSSFEDGSRVVVRRSVVIASESRAPQIHAVSTILGGSSEIVDSAIVGGVGTSVTAFDEGTRLSLTRALVTGTTAQTASESSGSAFAVVVSKNAAATFEDVAVVDNEQVGMSISFEATAEARGLLVSKTRKSPSGALGLGIQVFADARLALESSSVSDNDWFGLVVMRASALVRGSTFESDAAGSINTWETSVARLESSRQPSAREVVLVGNTFHEFGPDVHEGEVEVVLPEGAAPTRRAP